MRIFTRKGGRREREGKEHDMDELVQGELVGLQVKHIHILFSQLTKSLEIDEAIQ